MGQRKYVIEFKFGFSCKSKIPVLNCFPISFVKNTFEEYQPEAFQTVYVNLSKRKATAPSVVIDT